MSAAEKKAPDPGDAARRWWRSLQEETIAGESKRGNRAALARLRRASQEGAMAEEQTFELFRQLGYRSSDRLPGVATLACLLAHVRADNLTKKFGPAIGRQSIGDADSAVLKPLRFQALIVAKGEDEILRAFRRAVDILGGTANVADLARIILYWNDETRRRLAFEYYGAGLATPTPATPDTSPEGA